MSEEINIPCENVQEAVEFFTGRLGFRVMMVLPAEDPSMARLAGHGVTICLRGNQTDAAPAGGVVDHFQAPIFSRKDGERWITGRAGMEYRDLIPGKLGGRVTGSLIKVPAGPVADYVHFHKVHFQFIYCWHGKVEVVYEGQGEPFWLHPGDCVLQPPEIRHQVLQCAAGTQVIELTSPSLHETWADPETELPSQNSFQEHNFLGQRFARHGAAESVPKLGEFGDFESHHFGIHPASAGALHVLELRSAGDRSHAHISSVPTANFYFVLSGRARFTFPGHFTEQLSPGDAVTVPPTTTHFIDAGPNSEILLAQFEIPH